MENEINRWYKKLWETKGSRFIAAKRLEWHNLLSTITINLVSAYIIFINLLVLYPENSRGSLFTSENITYFTICFSILVLIMSNIITSRDYKFRANKLHECGRKINLLYDEVCILKESKNPPSHEVLHKLSHDYNNILDQYENHTRLDYLIFMAENISEYDKIQHPRLYKLKIKVCYTFRTFLVYPLIILFPLLYYFLLLINFF